MASSYSNSRGGIKLNKRLKMKRKKMLDKRYKFIETHIIAGGRRNGKTKMFFEITRALLSWKYGPFKRIMRIYNKLFLSIDFASGKDYTVVTHYKRNAGKITILKSETLE
jgi:hypothetical protein